MEASSVTDLGGGLSMDTSVGQMQQQHHYQPYTSYTAARPPGTGSYYPSSPAMGPQQQPYLQQYSQPQLQTGTSYSHHSRPHTHQHPSQSGASFTTSTSSGPNPTPVQSSVHKIFRKLELVGRGAYGAVFRGQHIASGTAVALKIVNLDTPDDQDVADIQREVALLSQLRDADRFNVVRYWGSWLEGPEIWLVMDLAEGGSVRTLMKAGPIAERHASIIVRETLVALAYLHRSGIIHRDIKAANILLTNSGRILLCDFGVAASLASATGAGNKRSTFVGTPCWMAPEVVAAADGKLYDQSADIWSLGITIYEMVTGNPPYASDEDQSMTLLRIAKAKPPRLPAEMTFSQPMRDFVATCLNDEPSERPSAEELGKLKWIKSTAKTSTAALKDLILQYNSWTKTGGMRMSLVGAQASLAKPGSRDSHMSVDSEWEFNEDGSRDLFGDYSNQPATVSETTMPKPPRRDLALLRLFQDENNFMGDPNGSLSRAYPPTPPQAQIPMFQLPELDLMGDTMHAATAIEPTLDLDLSVLADLDNAPVASSFPSAPVAPPVPPLQHQQQEQQQSFTLNRSSGPAADESSISGIMAPSQSQPLPVASFPIPPTQSTPIPGAAPTFASSARADETPSPPRIPSPGPGPAEPALSAAQTSTTTTTTRAETPAGSAQPPPPPPSTSGAAAAVPPSIPPATASAPHPSTNAPRPASPPIRYPTPPPLRPLNLSELMPGYGFATAAAAGGLGDYSASVDGGGGGGHFGSMSMNGVDTSAASMLSNSSAYMMLNGHGQGPGMTAGDMSTSTSTSLFAIAASAAEASANDKLGAELSRTLDELGRWLDVLGGKLDWALDEALQIQQQHYGPSAGAGAGAAMGGAGTLLPAVDIEGLHGPGELSLSGVESE
ncbi:hypothetical protein V8E36_008702 [Tilletia maclaganii]